MTSKSLLGIVVLLSACPILKAKDALGATGEWRVKEGEIGTDIVLNPEGIQVGGSPVPFTSSDIIIIQEGQDLRLAVSATDEDASRITYGVWSPQPDSLTYSWEILEGSGASLSSDDTASTVFEAPQSVSGCVQFKVRVTIDDLPESMTNPESDGNPANTRDDPCVQLELTIKVTSHCPEENALTQVSDSSSPCSVPYEVLWSRRSDYPNTIPPIQWINRTAGMKTRKLTISDNNFPCGQNSWKGLFVSEVLSYHSGNQALSSRCEATVDGFVVGKYKEPLYTAVDYGGGADTEYCDRDVGDNDFWDDFTWLAATSFLGSGSPDSTSVVCTHTYSCKSTELLSLQRTFTYSKTNWTLPGVQISLPNDARTKAEH